MSQLVECPECEGTGRVKDKADPNLMMTCSECDGTGEIEVDDDEQE